MDELTVYGWHEFWLGLLQMMLPCAVNCVITWLSLRYDGGRAPRVLPLLTYALLTVAGGGLALVWGAAAGSHGCMIDSSPMFWISAAIAAAGILAARFLFRCSWPAACWLAICACVCAWFASAAATYVDAVPMG